jgi:hypothetical protein
MGQIASIIPIVSTFSVIESEIDLYWILAIGNPYTFAE